MAGTEIFSDTMNAYERALNFRSMRHNLLTTNIANVNTPGFEAKDVEFESLLQDALSTQPGMRLVRTHPRHMGAGNPMDVLSSDPGIVTRPADLGSFDGNSVSIDKEMTKLSENSLLYQAETEVLARLFAGLKFAVTEGGGR